MGKFPSRNHKIGKMTKKIVIITGGSSGIGLEIAKSLCEKDYIVYNLSRSGKTPISHPNLFSVQTDVTNSFALSNAIHQIWEKEKTIYAIVCNAGNGYAGAIEDFTLDEIRMQFETNFFGVCNTIQACLPYLRQQNFGKIITISSLAAIFPIPYQAFYAASKAAIHSLTLALSIETKSFNIQCCSVLPGDTKTNFTQSRLYVSNALSSNSVYKAKMLSSIKRMEEDEQNGMCPHKVAQIIVNQIQAKKMKNVIIPGLLNKCLYALAHVLPNRLVLSILHKLYNN